MGRCLSARLVADRTINRIHNSMSSKIICSGSLICSLKTKRFLLLQRTSTKSFGQWGLVGGTNNEGETPWQSLEREIKEEIGTLPDFKKIIPLELFISNDEKFNFHTYLCFVKEEFIPILNEEHSGYSWIEFGKWPKPLHQGLRNTLNNAIIKTKILTAVDVLEYLED
jgi:ADP-ribose pyrophosphatase YjhB (NUDIX family)